MRVAGIVWVSLIVSLGAMGDERKWPLPAEDAMQGWVALFDRESSYGFVDAKVVLRGDDPALQGGRCSTEFADYQLRVQVLQAGMLTLSGQTIPLSVGSHQLESRGKLGPIQLSPELIVKAFDLKPLQLRPLFNGRDLNGWDRRGRVPAGKPGARWSVENGAIRVVGGPEALEYAPAEGKHLFDDFILQLTVRMRRPGTNGGLFFRNEPGLTMMGYEAQLHNPWYDPAAGQHGYTTGGIDDRQQARTAVAVDDVPFRMTVIAQGPHLASWVNGYQTVDWTDTRNPDPNPRRGLRLEPGTLQLQAHDPETDLEFQGIWLQELPRPTSSP
jgi:hypothetical protein